MDIKPNDMRFALLIDSDNVSARYIKPILTELSKYGNVTYKRIYGDWTLNLHAKWKNALLENSITPIQQFAYTQGKNATDSAMIIDAMDILYTNSVDGFCIVSSDSDFTRLVTRLRESGLMVIGMGEKKTPLPFRKACSVFTTLELLVGERSSKSEKSVRGTEDEVNATTTATREEIEQAVVDIISENENNGKATGLGEVGSRLQKRYPDFDVRSYGTTLLSKLLNSFGRVKITRDGSNVNVVLADDADTAAAVADDAAAAVADASVTTATATEGASTSAEEAAAPEKKSRRQRRRRKTTLNAEEPAADQPAEQPAEESAAEAATETVAEPAAEQPVEAASEPEAAEAPAKPKRTRRQRKPKAEPEQVTEQPVEVASEPEAAEAPAMPKRTRRQRKPKAEPEQVAEQPVEVEAAEPAAKATPEEQFLRDQIAAAGDAGALVSSLGSNVRKRFPHFKVREMGFQNIRLYLTSLEGISIKKVDGEYRAFGM